MWLTLLLASALVAFAGYLLVHWVAYVCLPQQPKPCLPAETNSTAPRLTVVVPFRNEAKHLPNLLAALSQQYYPREYWEVVLVDDHSTDDSFALVEAYLYQHPHLRFRCIRLANFNGLTGKKQALRTGIAVAQYPVIVTTDADCQPPPHWLTCLAMAFDTGADVVSGGICLHPTPTILGKIQALEQAGMLALGAGAIALHKPTLANGANFAFRKCYYNQVGGYQTHAHIASGDDELLLHSLARLPEVQIRFLKQPEAIVATQPQENWADFWQQRIRWVSKTRAYRNPFSSLGQVLGYTANLSLCLLPAWYALAAPSLLEIWLIVIAVGAKVIADSLLITSGCVLCRKQNLLAHLPIATIAYPLYVSIIGPLGTLSKSYNWKGRRQR
jgi:cellulose synthase/poly-beta-1,6-N-acetylglucosamine synthase-like glycosyltransferase